MMSCNLRSSTSAAGFGRFSYVAFENGGHYGFTEDYDPRFTLAFKDLELTDIRPSWAVGCAFKNNYNTAFGTVQSTLIRMSKNVVYSTVGNCEWRFG